MTVVEGTLHINWYGSEMEALVANGKTQRCRGCGGTGRQFAGIVAEDWSSPSPHREPNATVDPDRMRKVIVDGEPHKVRRVGD